MALSLMLFFCGGGDKGSNDSIASDEQTQKEAGLKPENTKISGDLSDAFVVIDKTYKPVKDMFTYITVEVERTDAPLPYDLATMKVTPFGYSRGVAHVGLGIEYLDDEGTVLEKHGVNNFYSSGDMEELIKLKP